MRRPSKAQSAAFKKDLKFFTDDMLPGEVLRFSKALAFSIVRGVVNKTPVGNPSEWLVNKNRPSGTKERKPRGYVGGHARMNWQVSLGVPLTGEVPGADPGGGPTILAGNMAMSAAVPYQQIWIMNNVSYILVLENGRGPDASGVVRGSLQAPHGMLAVTMEEVRRDFATR